MKCKGECELEYDENFLDERGICTYCKKVISKASEHLEAMNEMRFSPSPIPHHFTNLGGKNEIKEEPDPT